MYTKTKQKTNSVAWVRERTIPSDRRLSAKLVPTFADRVPRGQRDRSLRPYSWFSGLEPLVFYQVASQLYSRGWVDPVPDPLLLRKSGSAGSRTRASGSVAKNSDHCIQHFKNPLTVASKEIHCHGIESVAQHVLTGHHFVPCQEPFGIQLFQMILERLILC
jgi:hypothetical protein